METDSCLQYLKSACQINFVDDKRKTMRFLITETGDFDIW